MTATTGVAIEGPLLDGNGGIDGRFGAKTLNVTLINQDPPSVVMGDLDATPRSMSFQSWLDASGLIDSQRTHGMQPTGRASLGILGLRIDRVVGRDVDAVSSRELVAVCRRLGPSFGSNHRAVHSNLARRVVSP